MSDESVRRVVMDRQAARVSGPRRCVELEPAEALKLLGSISLGRIVFTSRALPAVRPVNHLLDQGDIIIRTDAGSALAVHTNENDGQAVVVAYEADAIDPRSHLGWSVIATGYAHLITSRTELDRYRQLLHPWVDQTMDHVIRVHPEELTGIRLISPPSPGT
ncbi:pyridoxamine 5'-phosphate oxidase family protein [Streptomyces sp. NPDC050549]|uniref:pyridoxamine 5'-phosphate oxidase family protein n=1 Tax=Streptomyces sp. NPDC050549 TaxID=3155406 RepID=UPI0034197808